jgi:ketosteroid isomerase-like protein
MRHPNEELIERFYDAFCTGDFRTMQDCYHDEATFRDPVFQALSSPEVKAMWEMLLKAARDLKINYSYVKANDHEGSAHWEAWYTFSKTGRKVHNVINASFTFRDGKIWRHEDQFDLWRWSRQALGMSGVLLGWSPLVVNKVRGTARRGLEKFMRENTTAR